MEGNISTLLHLGDLAFPEAAPPAALSATGAASRHPHRTKITDTERIQLSPPLLRTQRR